LVGNGSNVAAGVTPSGDVTLTNAGVFGIATGAIVNADVNGAAAISADKLADGSTNAIITLTQETNFESAYTHSTGDGSDHADVASNTTHRTSTGTDHTYIDQDVTTTASPGFVNVTSSAMGATGTSLATKDYVDGLINGLSWQNPVLDRQVDATLDPGVSPATGARYIIENSAALHANFGTITGVGDDDVVEYDGANFVVVYDASVEGEGSASWVEDEDQNYQYNGTAWVAFGSTSNHNSLSGLQGGTTAQYYHMTSAEHTAATRDATNALNGLMPSGKLTSWDAAATHATGDGSDHADVASNTTHRTSTGADHTYINQDVTTTGTPTFASVTMTNTVSEFSIDGTLAGDSDLAVPTEKAVKTYVDAQVTAHPSFADGETPTGLVNSANVTYTTANAPSPATSLAVYINGNRQLLTTHYSLSGSTITMVTAPTTGDNIRIDYRY
jgi:hypothetical protein